MAVQLEFFSVIIPIAIIEAHYPGGFEGFKKHHQSSLGKVIWYDDYLVREGAMNPADIESLVRVWQSMGLVAFGESEGRRFWKDLCVVDQLTGPTLPCEWLRVARRTVAHIHDRSEGVVGRMNYEG